MGNCVYCDSELTGISAIGTGWFCIQCTQRQGRAIMRLDGAVCTGPIRPDDEEKVVAFYMKQYPKEIIVIGPEGEFDVHKILEIIRCKHPQASKS